MGAGLNTVSSKAKARQRMVDLQFRQVSLPVQESATLDSYIQRLHRCRKMASFIWDCEPDYFITINSNNPHMTYEKCYIEIKKFGALLDWYFLGKKWSEVDSQKRTFFIAIPETAGGELHYHVLVRVPPKSKKLEEARISAGLYRGVH